MNNRKGEKIGWIGGWAGGFLWVLLTACLKLFQQEFINGLLGIALFALGISAALFFSPWRHPAQQYWKLMLAPVVLIFLALAWVIWLAEGYTSLGLNKWSVFLILLVFLPFLTAGRRRWSDRILPPTPKG